MSTAVICFFLVFYSPSTSTTHPPSSTTTRIRIDEQGLKQNQYSAPPMTAILTSSLYRLLRTSRAIFLSRPIPISNML